MQIQHVSDAREAECNDVCYGGVTINDWAQIEVYLMETILKTIYIGDHALEAFLLVIRHYNNHQTPDPYNPRDPPKTNRCRSTRAVGTRSLASALRHARI